VICTILGSLWTTSREHDWRISCTKRTFDVNGVFLVKVLGRVVHHVLRGCCACDLVVEAPASAAVTRVGRSLARAFDSFYYLSGLQIDFSKSIISTSLAHLLVSRCMLHKVVVDA